MADENTEIARGLRRRDPDLLDHLIEKYQHRLLRYLLYLTGRREMAEDFFRETRIRVLERGSQYDGRYEFSTWLFTIARNLVCDDLRRKRPASLDSLADEDAAAPFDIPATGQPSAFDATEPRTLNCPQCSATVELGFGFCPRAGADQMPYVRSAGAA
jgi:RNA polymerase sigma-70 factor (ECF subfamily)